MEKIKNFLQCLKEKIIFFWRYRPGTLRAVAVAVFFVIVEYVALVLINNDLSPALRFFGPVPTSLSAAWVGVMYYILYGRDADRRFSEKSE